MDYQNPTQTGGPSMGQQKSLPNSTAVLVLGILSIVLCMCYGIIGLACGIIAIVLAKKDKQLYNSMPDAYTIGSLKNLNAGRICAIIGVCLSSLYIVYVIFILATIGTAILSNPSHIFEQYR